MGNDYFQFRQFRINQGGCAMKVTTDACILGALCPLPPDVPGTALLDLGAGTGLLSLMSAQRHPSCSIDAVETDADAANAARNNFENSPWVNRLNLLEGDAVTIPYTRQYDAIISNPPFFANSLKSPKTALNLARHNDSLDNRAIAHLATRLLTGAGTLTLLLPYAEFRAFAEIARQAGLHLAMFTDVHHNEKATPKRTIGTFSKVAAGAPLQKRFVIYEADGYTEMFRNALSGFYLAM